MPPFLRVRRSPSLPPLRCTSTPLESLFKCSGSESLVGCANAVDLQHLYDSVASQCFHTCGSSFGEHHDQVRVSAQDNPLGRGLDEAFPHLPPCYFSRPCGFCSSVPTLPVHVVASRGGVEDCALPAQEVSQRDLKKLMDAHVRFGHRNFRSLAKALCLKLPSKMPFCTACVEAKATRHPKSRKSALTT